MWFSIFCPKLFQFPTVARLAPNTYLMNQLSFAQHKEIVEEVLEDIFGRV